MAEAWEIALVDEQQFHQPSVEEADAQRKSLLQPAAEGLWGEEIAEEEGWTHKEQ